MQMILPVLLSLFLLCGIFGLACMIVAMFRADCEDNGWPWVKAALSFMAAFVLIVPALLGVALFTDFGEKPRRQGAEAFHQGVSAEANPYQGMRNHGTESRAWLDGWLKAKQEGK